MTDLIGGLACGLVLMTFCMRDMARLRLIAIVSNIAFIVYAVRADLMPVLILHSILLPINLFAIRSMREDGESYPFQHSSSVVQTNDPLAEFYRVHAAHRF